MKKSFLIYLFFFGAIASFSQIRPKTKDIDKDANVLLDSLSKVYHMRVNSILIETQNGVRTTSISYVKNKELIYKVIKTEKTIILYSSLEKKLCQSAYSVSNKTVEGYQVKTFINANIQKTAEEALVKALHDNQAEYGCVVVMESNTGRIKAMVNLDKEADETYKYKTPTAILQTNEPGGLMRTFDLLALLEGKKADTTSVFDTHGGNVSFFGKQIIDPHVVLGKISLATAFNISSNTVFAQVISDSYSSNPESFCNRYKSLGLDKPLGLLFEAEGDPIFPDPKTSQWSNTTLPWLSIGYGLSVTPVQVLTFYNAIANNGVMVKPLFLAEIKDKEGNLKKYSTEIKTGLGVLALGGLSACLFMRYKTSRSHEWLVRTGFLVNDIQIGKKFFQLPFQNIDKIDMSPSSFKFSVNAMSKEKMEFNFPAVFTIGPKNDNESLTKFSRYLLNQDYDETTGLIRGIIEGETRSLAANQPIEEIFAARASFKDDIVSSVQQQLDQYGLEIYNANVEELKDSDTSNYFKSLSQRIKSEAENLAKVQVAEQNKKGNVGSKER